MKGNLKITIQLTLLSTPTCGGVADRRRPKTKRRRAQSQVRYADNLTDNAKELNTMDNFIEKKRAYFGLGALQAFIGLGAIGGGLLLVIDPSGSKLGLPSGLLEGTLFPNYLIPGIFLFMVNGIGSLIGAVFSFTKRRYTQEIAISLGAILVSWIVIQVIIIRSIGWLHGLYFILGIVEVWLGLYIRRHLFKAA